MAVIIQELIVQTHIIDDLDHQNREFENINEQLIELKQQIRTINDKIDCLNSNER